MAGKKTVPLPRLSGLAIWAPLSVLLLLGVITTVVDLMQVSAAETARANEQRQRFEIDPATGEVAMGKAATEKEEGNKEEFDIGTKEEAAEDTHEVAEGEAAKEPAEEHTEASAAEGESPPQSTEAPSQASSEHPATPAPAETAGAGAEAGHGTAPAATPADATKPESAPAATEVAPAAPTTEAPAPAVQATHSADVATKEEAAPPETMPALRTEPLKITMEAPQHTADSLVPAPAREVTETVNGMQLPRRGEKGATPSKLYAQPFKRTPEQVLISFVIVDVGLDPQSLGLIMALPKEVSVAYSPYAKKDTAYSEHMRAMGHEVWTMLPTMTERYPADDPGPLGLIVKMPNEEMVRRLHNVLAVIPGSVGLVLPPNENITSQRNELEPVVNDLEKRGLLLLSTHPTRSLEQITTNKALRPMLRRADLVLDPEPNESQIKSKLAGIMASATEKGEYLVVTSARPQTIKILTDWLKEHPFNEPSKLAPLSALYQPKEAVPEKKEEAGEHGGGHGGGEKKKEKKKPKPKPPKPLPQDKYKQPAKEEGGGGHH